MFLFQRQEVCWQYTSADKEQVYDGRTYLPRTVSRGAFDRNDEAGSSTVEVRLDRDLKVIDQFTVGPSLAPVKLTILRRHRVDENVIVLFKGVVANVVLAGEEAILTCVSPLSADEKSIPREIIMRTCPHVLYGERCQVNPNDWAFNYTIDSWWIDHWVISNIMTWPYTATSFTAGILVKDSTGESAFIQKHYWSSMFHSHRIYLMTPIAGLAASDEVTIYMGCDRKHTTCRDVFDNIPNFGGFPLHPERNPFIELVAD
jgi:uncharacterized phage protein (TIGR02218 family)